MLLMLLLLVVVVVVFNPSVQTYENVNSELQKYQCLSTYMLFKIYSFLCFPSSLVNCKHSNFKTIDPACLNQPQPTVLPCRELPLPSADQITPNKEPLLAGQQQDLHTENHIAFTITFTFEPTVLS